MLAENLQQTFIQEDVREHYELGQVIGKGSFSTVTECKNKTSNEMFAVKAVAKSTYNQQCKHQLENEIHILRKCSHDNIIKLIDVYETKDYIYLVMELVQGGELYSEVNDNGPLDEKQARDVFAQLFKGLQYLHDQGISHRDLKLENILYNAQKKQLKLTDFGLSKLLKPSNEEFMKTRCGTPSYVAPEVLLGEYYTKAVDFWSIGVVLYLLIFCEYPFQGNNMYEMYEKIISGSLKFPETPQISNELKDLLQGLLTAEPNERLTADGISNHPWLRNSSLPSIRDQTKSLDSISQQQSALNVSASNICTVNTLVSSQSLLTSSASAEVSVHG